MTNNSNRNRTYQRSVYEPGQKQPYKISRSKIELYMQCQRCFWLDARKHIVRPSSPPFTINKAIDELFKKEFDLYRHEGKPHPLMTEFSVDAIPMQHDKLDVWRQNFIGVSVLHEPTNFLVYGAIDDLWVGSDGKVIVVDYKATAKEQEVNIDSEWQIGYKRQLEIYQWLLKGNDLKVAKTGYFVYTNANIGANGFNDKIEFKTKLIPYKGDDSWVEPTLVNMKACLEDDTIPEVGMAAMGGPCEYCAYARSRTELTLESMNIPVKKSLKIT
jgi:CRISPR/Cas system-associated exonuclease Cas4 (RecB family)